VQLFERGDENLLPTFLTATTLCVKCVIIFFVVLAGSAGTDISRGLERPWGCLRQIPSQTAAMGASDPTSGSRLASEGHVYRARSEGRACHARRIRMDYQTLRRGRDERVPPRGGPDKQVPPKAKSERHARERFRSKPRASSRNDRTQAEIVISRKQGAVDKALVSSAHQKSGSSPPRGPGVTEPRGL